MQINFKDKDGNPIAAVGHANSGGKVNGIDVTVVSEQEAEEASFVVCVFEGMELDRFKKDNIYTRCFVCNRRITHRPHAPKTPPKICMDCAIAQYSDPTKV